MSRVRPLFPLATVAALAVLALTLVACGGGDDGPEQVIDSATLKGIESGVIDLSLNVSAEGKRGGAVEVSLAGPFKGQGQGKLPQLDLEASAKGGIGGEDVDFAGSLVLLPNSAYVGYEGVRYEVDPTTFSFVESALKQAEAESGGEGGAACQEAFGELEVGSFMDNLSEQGSVDVGGTSTTEVSGDLDVDSAIDAVLEIARSPACEGQLSAAGPLPSDSEVDEAKSQVGDAVKAAQGRVYVGEDDIVRRIAAEITIEPQDRSPEDPSKVEIAFDLQLTGVNEEQQISAPQGRTQPLSRLFIKLGVNPIELLGMLSGEGGGEGLDLGNLLEGLGGGR